MIMTMVMPKMMFNHDHVYSWSTTLAGEMVPVTLSEPFSNVMAPMLVKMRTETTKA
jgi:hypothetical protein